MRRQIITLFVSLFVVLVAPAAVAAEPRGALFKLEEQGHTLFVFGTMHVGLPEFYPLEPQVEEALAHASVVALEVDPRQDPQVVAQAMHRFGMLPPGQRVDARLAPADRERLDRMLKRAGMDPVATISFKPWLLATLLSLSEYAAQGYRTDLSVDSYVAAQARRSGAQVVELESLSSQLALFAQLDDTAQRSFLSDTLEAMENGKQEREVREVVEAWRTADRAKLDAIAKRAEEDQTMSGRFVQKVLLDGRNGALADKIAAQLKDQSLSVAAIGVLHLVGPKSVPALLQKKGIRVERVY